MSASRVVMHEIVLPHMGDFMQICFGGQVLSWIDICAGLAAKAVSCQGAYPPHRLLSAQHIQLPGVGCSLLLKSRAAARRQGEGGAVRDGEVAGAPFLWGFQERENLMRRCRWHTAPASRPASMQCTSWRRCGSAAWPSSRPWSTERSPQAWRWERPSLPNWAVLQTAPPDTCRARSAPPAVSNGAHAAEAYHCPRFARCSSVVVCQLTP